MSKQSNLLISENISELQSLLHKQDNPKNILGLQSLIHIKENRFKKRSELATYLDYSVHPMELWLKEYKGLEGILNR